MGDDTGSVGAVQQIAGVPGALSGSGAGGRNDARAE